METAVLIVAIVVLCAGSYWLSERTMRQMEKQAKEEEKRHQKLVSWFNDMFQQIGNLEAKRAEETFPKRSVERRRIRARSMSEAEQMAQAEYAKKA